MTVDTTTEPNTMPRDITPTILYPRPDRPVGTDTGARRELRLNRAQSTALERIATQAGGTPLTVLSAVYAAVLGRHTGTETVTFGVSVGAPGGFLGKTVLVCWDLPFAEYVAGVVAPELATATPVRSTPLPVMLTVRDSSDGPVRGAADLWLDAARTERGWSLVVEYDLAGLPNAVAAGILTSLDEALTRAMADPDRPLADLFTDAFPQQVSATDELWYRPPVWHLDGWLRRTLNRHADAVSLEENGSRLTYRNLAEAVRSTAAGLRRHGVRAGHVVGLTTDTLADTVVAMLAVLRIGAKYLALDLTLPPGHAAHQVVAAGGRVVIGTSVPGLPDGTLVLAPEDLIGVAGPWAEATPPARTGGYVTFTPEGTGVDLDMAPLFNLTAWQVAALRIDQDTRFLQYAPLGSAVLFQEVVPTLAMGGTVVALGDTDRGDLPALVARVARDQVTHLHLPVAELRSFVLAARNANVHFGHLRYLCVSGGRLWLDETVREFFADHPNAGLVSLYGPAETPAATTYRLSAARGLWPAQVPIGRPISGVSAQVIDRTGHLAPIGAPGELLLGGSCPAAGYVNDSVRTTERFEPDPYGPDGARRYRTGEVARWNEDANLELLEVGEAVR